MPKPTPKAKKPRKSIPRGKPPKAKKPLNRGTTKIRKVNPVAKAKRTAKFKKYLSSPEWKALRRIVFARDGYRCTARYHAPHEAAPHYPDEFEARQSRGGQWTMRCMAIDPTRSGKGLVCDHMTYARFGHEDPGDCRTLCISCNRRETVEKRANWKR